MKNYDCIKCKGMKMLCGLAKCPRVETARAKQKVRVDTSMSGPAPSVFIGSYGYPKLSVGPMVSAERAIDQDVPEAWYGTPLEDLVAMRYSLVRSKTPMTTSTATDPNKNLTAMQEIAMSVKAIDSEAFFKSKPTFGSGTGDLATPYGPSANLQKFQATENPRIPSKVDYIVGDELMSRDQMVRLYAELPITQVSKILSTGLLGKNKKLVPTRWSITATDDMIGKEILQQIRDCNELDEYLLFKSSYLGNNFYVMLFPGKWCFENIECYIPGNIWLDKGEPTKFVKDWEQFKGRTKYASNVTGAYYSARLGVAEWMAKNKRQAGCIVYREITPEYWCPIGVWQIRENVRAAMRAKPEKFQTQEEMLEAVQNKAWQKESELLSQFSSRSALLKFIHRESFSLPS